MPRTPLFYHPEMTQASFFLFLIQFCSRLTHLCQLGSRLFLWKFGVPREQCKAVRACHLDIFWQVSVISAKMPQLEDILAAYRQALALLLSPLTAGPRTAQYYVIVPQYYVSTM